jgi:Spy/CpxP family protein refolding chaperone
MVGTLRTVAAAAVFAAAASVASMAGAASASVGQLADGVSNHVTRVHGDHSPCQRDRRGWHRHNRWGERRQCRAWHGRGRRPDVCVRVGPIWYCDY